MPVRITRQIQVALYISAGFLFVFFIALAISSRITDATITVFYNSPHYRQVTPQPKYYRQLDGQLVESEAQQQLTPFIVMIENYIDSRPVAGLESASVIYEAIIEGEVTRYMAVFDQEVSADRIGPVRSARPFFVSLAEEWEGMYFHAGGSPAALAKLKTSSMYNINEISGDGIYFWRDTKRAAPHNLYTSADQMRRAMAAKGVTTTTSLFLPWQFKEDADVSQATFDYASATSVAPRVVGEFAGDEVYRVDFRYSVESNDYTRYLAGEIHKTESGIILKANNILKQYVDAAVIDSYGRLDVAVTGSGTAELYQDGTVQDIYWERTNNRTKYFDSQGSEISLNRGVTWILLEYL